MTQIELEKLLTEVKAAKPFKGDVIYSLFIWNGQVQFCATQTIYSESYPAKVTYKHIEGYFEREEGKIISKRTRVAKLGGVNNESQK